MSRVRVRNARSVAPRIYKATCNSCDYFELGLHEPLLIEADLHARTCATEDVPINRWPTSKVQRLADAVWGAR